VTAGLASVLVMMAHPDDPEFFCGGTLARWVREGREVRYVLATSGDKGCDDGSLPTGEVVARREAEQRAAADVLGIGEVIFLRYRDGELVPDMGLRRQLVRAIRLYRPEVVVTTDPQLYLIGDQRVNHPDHRAMGDAVLAAVFPAASNPRFFPELWEVERLAPHAPREVYIANAGQPNHEVDITDLIDQKAEAIRQHKSQLTDPAGQLERVRQRAAREGGQYVESFRRIVLR
jgi:LmbE family N-acetylglucosaminyl deacetylase